MAMARRPGAAADAGLLMPTVIFSHSSSLQHNARRRDGMGIVHNSRTDRQTTETLIIQKATYVKGALPSFSALGEDKQSKPCDSSCVEPDTLQLNVAQSAVGLGPGLNRDTKEVLMGSL